MVGEGLGNPSIANKLWSALIVAEKPEMTRAIVVQAKVLRPVAHLEGSAHRGGGTIGSLAKPKTGVQLLRAASRNSKYIADPPFEPRDLVAVRSDGSNGRPGEESERPRRVVSRPDRSSEIREANPFLVSRSSGAGAGQRTLRVNGADHASSDSQGDDPLTTLRTTAEWNRMRTDHRELGSGG